MIVPTHIKALGLLLALSAAATQPAAAHPASLRPEHIVSVNMCTDELLLRLAEQQRIASITWLSQNPRNANMADAARSHVANHGLAEEVLNLRPDLVLAGAYTARATVAMLKRIGLPVVEFGVPTSIAQVIDNIREMARVLGEDTKGDAMIASMNARLAKLAQDLPASKPRAIVLRPNGFTAAKGSLIDDIIRAAGLVNLAAELGYTNYAQAPLETLVLEGADVLIIDNEPGIAPSQATEVLSHPVIRKLAGRLKVVSLPSRLWTCAGPSVVDAVEMLREQTRDLPLSQVHHAPAMPTQEPRG